MPKAVVIKNICLRNPEKTRERILEAALKEFAAKGLTGARVDEIARRAKVNKRMLYHYFGNKRELFRAVLRRKIAERKALAETISDEPTENMPRWFQATCGETDWVHLLTWESLQSEGSGIEDEEARRESFKRTQNHLKQRQDEGLLNAAFDVRYMALARQALTMFPKAFPNLTYLITGKLADDLEFQREYMIFLKELAAAFQPPAKPGKDPSAPANDRAKNPGASAPGNE
jgi:TetR/AcrR family transcriptional regulator